MNASHPIIPALEAAVPLNALEMQRQPLEELWSRFERERDRTVELLACKGDILLFGHGKHKGKKGEIAEVFNCLARMLGFMSVTCPGGVKVFGCHWEFPHPDISSFESPVADILDAFNKEIEKLVSNFGKR